MRNAPPFAAEYEVRPLDDGTFSPATYSFARADALSTGVDVLIEVAPHRGEAWVGAVRRPPSSVRGAITDVFPSPHPCRVCVVVQGDAYLIDVDQPTRYGALDSGGPVVAVHPVVEEGVLLLASPWCVTAVDDSGRAWQTARLARFGLRLDEVDGGRLAGVADPDDDEPRDFVIDLRTGSHEGGAPFANTTDPLS